MRPKMKNMNSDSGPKVTASWIFVKENENTAFPTA